MSNFVCTLPRWTVRNSGRATLNDRLSVRPGLPGRSLAYLAKESHGPEATILLMGQILNADTPDQRVKNFRVFLLRGKRITGQTNASPLGEFRFEFADAKNWRLLFEVAGQEVIPISLPELTSRSAKASQ